MNSDRVIIKLSTNKRRGTFTAEVVGHEGTAKCSDAVDEALINDILNMEIEGFGEMTKVEDSGKTNEYYDEEAKKHKVKALKIDDPPFPDDEGSSKKTKVPLGLGYGV